MKHFYPITVAAVGRGIIRSSDGKTLTCIGSMPVQVGDTVYTDGRVVYGHSPIKASGAVFNPVESLVPFFVMGYSAYQDVGMLPCWGGFARNGNQRLSNKKLNNVLIRDINWLYADKNKCYGNDYFTTISDHGDYIDVFVDNGVVYTAEFTTSDKSFAGKNASAGTQGKHLRFIALNLYMLENDNFALHYTTNGGDLDTNAIIAIKRNGVVINSFALGDYIDTLDDLKNLYLSYDESGDNYKRYTHESYLEGESGLWQYDIWCSYIYTQLLSLSFTGGGQWEAVILSICEGAIEPHTVDQEYNRETDEWENVYSNYSISCPVLYKVMKITSSGGKSILQERKFINKLENNGVINEDWVNAAEHYVEEVSYISEPYFTINYGNASITTNLRNIGKLMDKNGRTIASNLPLDSFVALCTTDPESSETGGAIRKCRIYMLDTGRSYIEEGPIKFLGFNSLNSAYAPRVIMRDNRASVTYGTSSESLIERASFYLFDDKTYLVCLRNNWLLYVRPNGRLEYIGRYPSMLNLEMIRVGRQKELGTMADLIAATNGNTRT